MRLSFSRPKLITIRSPLYSRIPRCPSISACLPPLSVSRPPPGTISFGNPSRSARAAGKNLLPFKHDTSILRRCNPYYPYASRHRFIHRHGQGGAYERQVETVFAVITRSRVHGGHAAKRQYGRGCMPGGAGDVRKASDSVAVSFFCALGLSEPGRLAGASGQAAGSLCRAAFRRERGRRLSLCHRSHGRLSLWRRLYCGYGAQRQHHGAGSRTPARLLQQFRPRIYCGRSGARCIRVSTLRSDPVWDPCVCGLPDRACIPREAALYGDSGRASRYRRSRTSTGGRGTTGHSVDPECVRLCGVLFRSAACARRRRGTVASLWGSRRALSARCSRACWSLEAVLPPCRG